MSKFCAVRSELADSRTAGHTLGEEIRGSLGESPHALIAFASPRYKHEELLEGLSESCRPDLLIGCSSAGEFAAQEHGHGSVSAVAIHSDTLRFAAGVGRGLRSDRASAAKAVASGFRGQSSQGFSRRAALILTDALAGHVEDLLGQLTLATSGGHQFFGGGAGDDGRFQQTQVFFGTEVLTDAVVGLEILSKTPLGIGVGHGWEPAGRPLRVTEARGSHLVSLNSMPACESFSLHAQETQQTFDPRDPMPFFLHNVLGIQSGPGYKLRVPLQVEADGSVLCAADVPEGATVQIMRTGSDSAADAAASATRQAVKGLMGHRPGVGLFFDCAATRLRMGAEFGLELRAVQENLGVTRFAGCNTYGQIARSEGQLGGFHNCTAVACVIPE